MRRQVLVVCLLCLLTTGCTDRKELPDIGNGYRSITASPIIDTSEYRPDAFYFNGTVFYLKDVLICSELSKLLADMSQACASEEYPAKDQSSFEQELLDNRTSFFHFNRGDTTVSVKCLRMSGSALSNCEFVFNGPDYALVYDARQLNVFYQNSDTVKLRYVGKEDL